MLRRRSLGEGLAHIFEKAGIGRPGMETQYENLLASVKSRAPKAILLEVPESGTPDIHDCLKLADEIKEASPSCKILLMCSELDEVAVKHAILARKEARVDDFVFYDTSVEYLKASLSALF